MENEFVSADKYQSSLSLWERISIDTPVVKEIIKFELNIPEIIEFPIYFSAPKERNGKTGAFCVFEVIHIGKTKVLRSSAITLLRGLKRLEPLAGKIVSIEKLLIDGKQYFDVREVA